MVVITENALSYNILQESTSIFPGTRERFLLNLHCRAWYTVETGILYPT